MADAREQTPRAYMSSKCRRTSRFEAGGTKHSFLRFAALGIGAAGLLAGCMSPAPPYVAPAMPVPPRYGDGAFAGEETAADRVSWEHYFEDPALRQLIGRALGNNRDLRIAVLRVEEARAAYGIARADRLPTLGAQAVMGRFRIPATAGTTLLGNEYVVGLAVASWELDFWGRVRSLGEAALDSYLATEAAQRAATLSLITQTAIAYLALRELDERIALARQTMDSRAESLRIFTRRVAVGSTSRLNLTQVQTLLLQAQALLAQLKQKRDAQAHALSVLVGEPLELTTSSTRLNEKAFAQDLPPGLPSYLLVNRPDVVAAEYRLKSANASIGAARAAFFPRISLTGAFGAAGPQLDGLFSAGGQAWLFSPSISLPLFDDGRNRNNLSLAEARKDMAVAQYERTVQEAFRDVSDALTARVWLTEQVGIATAALSAQAQRARLSQLRYDNGAASFLEVLDAQRELLAAGQQLVQSRAALLMARVELYAALGGGPIRTAGADGARATSPSR
jgi:multidrug efflux system outer membrane protein